MVPALQPDCLSEQQNGKRTLRVPMMSAPLLCCLCGRVLTINPLPAGRPPHHVEASCMNAGCKLQRVRLKVPVRTIECEVL